MEHTIVTAHGLVTDSWLAIHPDSPPWPYTDDPSTVHLSAADRIRVLGITCNSLLNTWRANRSVAAGVRLDYVFVNQNHAVVKDSKVVFTEPIEGLGCSYSDHFGITVKLQIQDGDPIDPKETGQTTLSAALFQEIDAITNRYIAREARDSYYRNLHFFAALIVFVALLVGQWWVTAIYGHFIVLLGTVLIVITGVVNGLIGFLFGNWELRALREFQAEVNIAKTLYSS